MKEATKELTREECEALYNKAWEQKYSKRKKLKAVQAVSVEDFVKVLVRGIEE